MSSIRPSLIPPSRTGIPEPNRLARKEWVLSFRYYRQIPYFGLDGAEFSNSWSAALLARLASFTAENAEDLMGSNKHRGAGWRFHPINWSQPKIPICREDLNWIPQSILGNPEEYPFYQFSISQGSGRVVGFPDGNIFFVVLLDPLHNAQPSKDYDYKVNDCYPILTPYEELFNRIESLRAQMPCNGTCHGVSLLEANGAARLNVIHLTFQTVQDLEKWTRDKGLSCIDDAILDLLLERL